MTKKYDSEARIELLKISLSLTLEALSRGSYTQDNLDNNGNRIDKNLPDYDITKVFHHCNSAVIAAYKAMEERD